MSMDVRKVRLDFNKTFQQCIPSVQGDTGRSIEFQIMDGSLPEDITGETVKIFGLKPDGFRVFNNATITDARNGKCVVDLTLQMLCVAGIVQCTLVRYKNDEKLSSRKFNIEVAKSVADDIEIESTSEYLALTEALSNMGNDEATKTEVVSARKGFETLGKRLDDFDLQLETMEDEKANISGAFSSPTLTVIQKMEVQTESTRLAGNEIGRNYIIIQAPDDQDISIGEGWGDCTDDKGVTYETLNSGKEVIFNNKAPIWAKATTPTLVYIYKEVRL